MPEASVDVEATPRISRRTDTDLAHYLLFRRHRFAYETALSALPADSVIADIGCGLGYQAEMLRSRARKIIAIDAAQTALDALPDIRGLEKIRANAAELPLADSSVDGAFAFQLIEHVDEESALQIVCHMRRVIKPGGTLFLTTPNAQWRLLKGQLPWNAHHVKEYYPKEMASFCIRAGIPLDSLFGVVGLDGADVIEKFRVMQHPGKVFGRSYRARWLRWRQRLFWFTHAALFRLGQGPPSEIHQQKQWFLLDRDYFQGLDFLVRFQKPGADNTFVSVR